MDRPSRPSAGARSRSCCRRSARSSAPDADRPAPPRGPRGRRRRVLPEVVRRGRGRAARCPRPASVEPRSDRATAEGLPRPAMQALVEQAAPFADALAAPRPTAARRCAPADRARADVLMATAAAGPGLYGPQPALRGAARAGRPRRAARRARAAARRAAVTAAARRPAPTPRRGRRRRAAVVAAGVSAGLAADIAGEAVGARPAVRRAEPVQEARPRRARPPDPRPLRPRAGPPRDRGRRRRRRREDRADRPARRRVRGAPTTRSSWSPAIARRRRRARRGARAAAASP